MIELEVVTPDRARELLAVDSKNRSVRPPQVGRLAADMASGKWREDLCPPLILGPGDAVVDGQHRLRAVAISGVSVRFEIRRVSETSGYGLPIDIGINRTPKDLLLRTAKVAQIINTLAKIESGKSRVPRKSLLIWDAIVGDTAARLQERFGGDVRIMTTAPVRAGFVLSSLTVGSDLGEDFVFNAYSDLKSARLETSPLDSIGALYRRLLNETSRSEAGTVTKCWIVVEAFRRRDAMIIKCPRDVAKMASDLRDLLSSLQS